MRRRKRPEDVLARGTRQGNAGQVMLPYRRLFRIQTIESNNEIENCNVPADQVRELKGRRIRLVNDEGKSTGGVAW